MSRTIQKVLSLPLRPTEKLILVYLHTCEESEIQVSVREMAAAVGSNPRWIQQCLRTLQSKKLIQRRALYNPDGGQGASIFQLTKRH